MLFENPQIDIESLPKVQEVEYLPLQQKYKVLLIINSGVFFAMLAAAIQLVLMNVEEGVPITVALPAFAGVALLWMLRLLGIFKGFPLKGYAIREHDIVFRTGWINRKITSIPFNRIQHSEVRQSFLARFFKITKLKVFTAGGNTSDLAIHGLSHDEAVRIKDFLSKTISSHE